MFDWLKKIRHRRAAPPAPGADVSACRERGNSFLVQGKLVEAEVAYREALALAPHAPETHVGLAWILIQQQRDQEARPHLQQTLALDPHHVDAHFMLAGALEAAGDLIRATAHCEQALAANPDFGPARRALCRLLAKQDKVDGAIDQCRIALQSEPGDAMLHNDLGALLQRRGRFDDAIQSYRQAHALQPESVAVLNNLGSLLHERGCAEDAAAHFYRALALEPESAELHHNMGLALQDMGHSAAALEHYCRATALAPDFASAHWLEALCHLQLGDFEQGWKKYEWRWKNDALKKPKPDFRQPPWLGNESLNGKTILLYSEQGLGDAIQFYRYTELLAARGAAVIMQVPGALKSLLGSQKTACRVLSKDEPLPAFDYYCPLLSLGLAFATTLDSIPAPGAYLAAAPAAVEQWRMRLGPRTLPRIGLVWSGSPLHANDRNRSMPLDALTPLLSPRFQFVSLQKEIRPSDAQNLQGLPAILRHGEELADFGDTAGLIANLDLVITVDTSVAHLAGALGKPVWIALPLNADWRWLLERSDSPWYPSARLFRQARSGDWASVVSAMADALDKIEMTHPPTGSNDVEVD